MSDQQRPAPQEQDQPAEGGDIGQPGAETTSDDRTEEDADEGAEPA